MKKVSDFSDKLNQKMISFKVFILIFCSLFLTDDVLVFLILFLPTSNYGVYVNFKLYQFITKSKLHHSDHLIFFTFCCLWFKQYFKLQQMLTKKRFKRCLSNFRGKMIINNLPLTFFDSQFGSCSKVKSVVSSLSHTGIQTETKTSASLLTPAAH